MIRKNSWFYKNIDEVIRDFSAFGNPVILFILWILVYGISWDILVFVLGMAFIEIVGGFVKIFWYKDRPEKEAPETVLDKVYAGSFPSIHVARAMFIFTMISLKYFGMILLLFPFVIASVAFNRLYTRRHFISDVVGGFILGIIAVVLVILFVR